MLWRFPGFNLAIPRDHFRAAAPQTRHFANALGRSLLAFGEKFPKQFVEPDQAHLRFFERGKMQQVLKLFLVQIFGVRARGKRNPHPRLFEHADDVIRSRFSLRAETRDQLAANLLDFGGGEPGLPEFARELENQGLF